MDYEVALRDPGACRRVLRPSCPSDFGLTLLELALAARAGLESRPTYVVSLEGAPAHSPFGPLSLLAGSPAALCDVLRVDGRSFHLDAFNVRLLKMVARNMVGPADIEAALRSMHWQQDIPAVGKSGTYTPAERTVAAWLELGTSKKVVLGRRGSKELDYWGYTAALFGDAQVVHGGEQQ